MHRVCIAAVALLLVSSPALAEVTILGVSVQDHVDGVLAFVRANERWVPWVVFGLSFAESLAIISLIVPASVMLATMAALLGGAHVSHELALSVWAAGSVGATLGYAVSYWVGRLFEGRIHLVRPFSWFPEKMVYAREAFQRKGGVAAVFFGHFFGQVRWVIPLIAGSMAMPQIPFQVANVISAVIWAGMVIVLPLYGVMVLT